jgi:hypothetical protein
LFLIVGFCGDFTLPSGFADQSHPELPPARDVGGSALFSSPHVPLHLPQRTRFPSLYGIRRKSVTESLWLQDSNAVLDQVSRLRRMGVSIALEDFGTGYSSLTYLWKFPFDTVKIDRSFVMEMETEPKAAAIINTIVALGKTLDNTITAEGVETPTQAQFRKRGWL